MFPIGKFTLSIIGLRLFGGYGFLWGMFLGHMLIDRTILRKIIKQYISTIDDNIRIMLPYKYYRYYSRIENSIFGILYGSILGAVTFGFPGFIVFFLLGHLFFDLPDNQHFSRFRSFFETFWNEHWGKILGVLIGLSLHSNWIIVIGVILGFVLKEYASSGTYSWSDGLTNDVLNVNKLKEMIDEVIRLEITPNPRYKDKYIVAMTPAEKAFNEITSAAFGIPLNMCTSIPNTRERIRSKMKEFSFPIWTLKYILEKETLQTETTVLSEIMCSRLEDKAFCNSFRYVIVLVLSPMVWILLAVLYAQWLPWFGVISALVLTFPAHVFVHIYAKWFRLVKSSVRFLRNGRLRSLLSDIDGCLSRLR